MHDKIYDTGRSIYRIDRVVERERLKKKYIYIRKWGRKRSSFDLLIQRQPDDGNG